MSYWPTVNLGSCAEIVSGATPSTSVSAYWDGEIFWATPKDLSELKGAYISSTLRTITKGGFDSCAAAVLPPNSVLFSSRAPIGHVAINTVPMTTNQGFKSFIPDRDRLHAKFLYHWLRKSRPYLEGLGRGATFKEVSKAIVSRIEIPLPPLPEQLRIAEVLDKADALRTKRRAAIAQLDALTQSIFIDMFGDPATNPKGWRDSMLLGDVTDIVSGVTIGRKLDGRRTRTVPYLAVVNVQDRHLDLSVTKTTEATEKEIQRYRLERNDLLLTEGGDPDKLGRGTLWRDELPECIHQNHVFRVRLQSEELTPLFLNWLVGSQRGKRYFLRSAKQTTGIASINMTQLRAFPLLVPPLPLQQQFANQVSASDELKTPYLASLAELDALFASIQHRAFDGDL